LYPPTNSIFAPPPVTRNIFNDTPSTTKIHRLARQLSVCLRRPAHYQSSTVSGNNSDHLGTETPKTTRATASRNRLNATLVAVIVMLVVLVYPCEILDFVVHLGPLGQTTAVDEEAMMLTRMILNALQLSNFALNFFLYCTLNVQFRRAFVDWFCRRRQRRRDVRARAALGADAARVDNQVVRLNAGLKRPS